MATSFKREPKMMTTEPSVDEVGHGMKKGGMMMGGRMSMMPNGRMMKKGGKAEGGKSDMAQDKAMIKKAMKQHDAQEHKGGKGTDLKLRAGGMSSKMRSMAPKAGPNVMGGLEGGIEATRPMGKRMSGTIEGPGYKKGGQALAAKGDAFQARSAMKPKINVKDKVVGAKQTKGFNTKTGGVSDTTAGGKPAGYKKGGTVSDNVANRYKNTLVHDGSKMPTVKGKTGDIKQRPAGYKDGGHVAMTCKNEGGYTSMKKMQNC
jgi:hypothetical protein